MEMTPKGKDGTLKRYLSSFKKKPSAAGPVPRRLTNSELSALFRRLDANGDGELSITEFRKIVTKFKFFKDHDAESVIDDVFLEADKDKTSSGSLTLDEFKCAYNKLYNIMKQAHEGDTKSLLTDNSNVIRATRYGTVSIPGQPEQVVFEVYQGSLNAIEHKIVYKLDGLVDELTEDKILSTLNANGIITIDLVNYQLEHLNSLILADSRTNEEGTSSIMWWVDYCCSKLRKTDLEKYSYTLGLPTSVVDRMSSWESKDKHISFGRAGDSSGYQNGDTGVMSIYLQALYLRNIPIVSRDPVFARRFGLSYFSSKLVHFRPFLYKKRCHEYVVVSSLAARELEALWGDEFKDVETTAKQATVEKEDLKSSLHALNNLAFSRKVKSRDHAQYLLSTADLTRREVGVGMEPYSLHIQSHGSAPMVLHTLRVCHGDQDGDDVSFIQQSKTGILGRITFGVWKKLLQVIAHHGTAHLCGELDDSTFALSQLLITMVNSTSMETVQKLDDWSSRVSESIEEVAVTKHSKHMERIKIVTKEVLDYVVSFNRDFEEFVDAYDKFGGIEIFESEYKSRVLIHQDTFKKTGRRQSVLGVAAAAAATVDGANAEPETDDSHTNLKRAPKAYDYFVADGNELKSNLFSLHLRSRDRLLNNDAIPGHVDIDALPIIAETKDANSRFKLMQLFANKNVQLPHTGSLNLLPVVVRGYDTLEKRGTKYWQERLNSLLERANQIEDRYHMCLDEKRNFWAFVLGIVSIATFPFSVMTGYFGMNFENMAAPGHILTNDYWPAFPGSDFIWIMTIIIYGLMLLFMLHYDIFYAAS